VIKRYIVIFIVASGGGWLFSLVNFPLPWTLGPLTTVMVLKLAFKMQVFWPIKLRNLGMAILGYVLGSPFTPQTGHQILSQLPEMMIMTLLIVVFFLSGGYIIGRYLNLHLSTSLLGSMPGGLAQMAIIAEDIEGSDASAITLMQTVRFVTSVFLVPFLVLHGLADEVDQVKKTVVQMNADQLPVLLLFAATIFLSLYIAKRVRVPSPYLMVPVVGTAVLVLSGINAPVLPPLIPAVAQIFVGIRLGMGVEFSSLGNWKKLLTLNFISVFLIIILFLGIDYVFAQISGNSFVTAFICTAPGGITEMGLTAIMVHADLSTVIAFQLFRLLFILLVAIPLIKWWLCRKNRECITYSPIE
jgi:membrane AbrB-like protein